jgi:hypothetical protein
MIEIEIFENSYKSTESRIVGSKMEKDNIKFTDDSRKQNDKQTTLTKD